MKSTLTPPKALEPFQHDSVSDLIQLDADVISTLDMKANEYVADIFDKPDDLKALKETSRKIQHLGYDDIRSAASISSRLLERPVSSIASGLFDDASPVSRALLDLRATVEELDPSNHYNLLSPRRLFGIFPLSGNIKKYFRKYHSAQSHLNAIICSLNNGKDELLKDNALIEEERANIWQSMESMEKHIYFSKQLDTRIVDCLAKIEPQNPENAKIIKEELLFYLRQKVQDLLTQLTVSIQGYLAMDLVAKNNVELIKGIDRSTNTTVSALRTAVTVAQALANEKLVLEQVKALNETTGRIIEGTSEALKRHAGEVHNNASGNTIEVEKIKSAFGNIYEAIDMIDQYKVEALDQMRGTIDVLVHEVDKAKIFLSRYHVEQPID